MSVESRSTKCGQCGESLTEDPGTPAEQKAPCPKCGSIARTFTIAISSTVELHSQRRLKTRPASGGRPLMEQTVGSDLHRKTGVWMKIERVIDRVRDWYRERVINPQTGEIVHQCEEPLSEHRGHGAAKKRPDE